MQEKAMMGDALAAGLTMNTAGCVDVGAPRFHYALECRDADGNLRWADEFDNLVTTAGKTDLVNKYFKGAAYTAAWYLGCPDQHGNPDRHRDGIGCTLGRTGRYCRIPGRAD